MKKTGKALSLVLSLALVVSSIPATFASAAATRTESLTSLGTDDSTVLVTGDTTVSTDLSSLVGTATGITYDHLSVSSMQATEVAHKDGPSLLNVTFSATDKTLKVKLKDAKAEGTETLAVRYTATSHRYSDPTVDILFTAEKDLKIKVVKPGVATLSLDKVAKNNNATVTGSIVSYKKGTEGLKAVTDNNYKVVVEEDAVKGLAVRGTTPAAAAGDYYVTVPNASSNDVAITADANSFTVTLSKKDSDYVNVGSILAYARKVKNPAVDGASKADAVFDSYLTATGAVQNTVNIGSRNYISTWHGSTWASDSSKTWADESSRGEEYGTIKGYKPCDGALNITGCDVTASSDVTMSKGVIGTITTTGKFTLNDASSVVGAVKADTAEINNGTVKGLVNVNSLTVNGGNVGSVDTTDATIDSTDAKIATKVGAVSARSLTVKASNGNVTVSDVTKKGIPNAVEEGPANDRANTVTLSDAPTIGEINFDHFNTTLDLKGFTGTVATPKSSESAELKTEANSTKNTNATVTGSIGVDAVDAENGTLTVANSVESNTVSGMGTVVIPAGAMRVRTAITGISLKLANTNFSDGMTVLYVPAYTVYSGAFTTVGYTLDYDAANVPNTTALQPLKIKSTEFAAISIAPVNGNSNKIVKGTSATYKVSAYPAGQSFPAEDVVKFDFSGSSENFNPTKITKTADTITIEGTKYEPLFNSLNQGTITATLVNKDTGIEDYRFKAATYDVVITEKAEQSFKSDTSYKDMKVGETYQFKITSADGSQPDFVVASKGATVVDNGKSGNDYFYKVTAAKVGTFGIYCGDKVAIIKVTSGISTDTKTVTKKAGETYQFKITVSNGKAPEFKIATVGAVKASSSKGNDFFFKYTVKSSDAKGTHGVYVNGERLASFIFA